MHGSGPRLTTAVVAAAGLTAGIFTLLPDDRALDVQTDIVGYPIAASFNIDLYFWSYGLVVVFFPLVAIGLYLALTRYFVGRRGPWRPLPQPQQNIEVIPAVTGWRERAVAGGRTLFVGGVLGLEVAIWLGEASEAVLVTCFVYAAAVVLAGWVAERVAARDRIAVMSAVNVLTAPIMVAGLWAVSASTEVTVAATGTVHGYHWLPTWMALGATAAVLAVVAVGLRRRRVRADLSALERRVVLLVAAPIALFVFMAALPGDLGTFDAFEEGQALVGSEAIRAGAFPWRDVVLPHGLLFDVSRGLVGGSVFDDSRWGMVAADEVLLQPFVWIAVYYLCAYLVWTNWLFLAGTQLLVVTGYFTAIDIRMLLTPFCLLLLAALLARPTVLRAVAFTVMVAVQVLVTPEALVVALAAFAAIAGFEFSYRERGQRFTSGYPRVKLCLATIGALAVGWAIVLAAYGALDDWVYAFASTIPGHRLTGGVPLEVPKTDIEIVAPIVLILVVYAFVVARVRSRRPFAYQDWLMVAMGALTLLYFTKFLARADPDHLAQSFAVAVPLLFYLAFRAITYGEAWLAHRAEKRGLSEFPSRHTLTLPLLVILLVVAPVALPNAIRAAPGHFIAEASQEPEVARIGYARPGENDPRLLASLDAGLDTLLEPGETVFDFTNSPGVFHYLLDLPPSNRYYHVSYAIRQRTQSDLIQYLAKSPPGAAIAASEREFNNLPEWDGIPNEVRHYDVSEYLLDHYVPVRKVGGFVLMAREGTGVRANPELYFRIYPCDWRYAPNFFSPRPPDSAKAVRLPLHIENANRFTVTLPAGAADYGWLELRSATPFAEGTFDFNDRDGRYTRRSISFKTRGRGETTVRVKVGACSQWRGYRAGTLHFSTDVPQSVREVRLVR